MTDQERIEVLLRSNDELRAALRLAGGSRRDTKLLQLMRRTLREARAAKAEIIKLKAQAAP